MKGKIVLLPTTKETILHFDFKLFLSPSYQESTTINSSVSGRNIYITCDGEIKDNDWYLGLWFSNSTAEESPTKFLVGDKPCAEIPCGKKIIFTTDKVLIADGVLELPRKFLELYIKNPLEVIHFLDNSILYDKIYIDYPNLNEITKEGIEPLNDLVLRLAIKKRFIEETDKKFNNFRLFPSETKQPEDKIKLDIQNLIDKFKFKPFSRVLRQDFSHSLYNVLKSHDLVDLQYHLDFDAKNNNIVISPIRTIDKIVFKTVLNNPHLKF